jgi:beta-xylosidase
MKTGDVAGLSLFSVPYARIGVKREENGLVLTQFDEQADHAERLPITQSRVWLRAKCDFMTEKASFSYSVDGKSFQPFGTEFNMVFQCRTFQGVRYGLFHFNSGSSPGGVADFDSL